jgi:hypothetical protein
LSVQLKTTVKNPRPLRRILGLGFGALDTCGI